MGEEYADRRWRDRRRTWGGLVYPERRTGFDRRLPSRGFAGWYHRVLHAYRSNSRTIFLVLALVTVLNLADLVLTQRALILGAVEANPIMAALFDRSPYLAGIVKMSVGMIVVEVIWALRRYRRALELSIFAAVGMSALFLYHLVVGQNLPI